MRNLAVILFAASLAIGLALGAGGLLFGAVFFALFLLPIVPWAGFFSDDLAEQFVYCFAVGLAGIPLVYFLIGIFHGRLSAVVYAVPSLLVFVAGIISPRHKLRHAHKGSDQGTVSPGVETKP